MSAFHRRALIEWDGTRRLSPNWGLFAAGQKKDHRKIDGLLSGGLPTSRRTGQAIDYASAG
jgi:hypothetical protein